MKYTSLILSYFCFILISTPLLRADESDQEGNRPVKTFIRIKNNVTTSPSGYSVAQIRNAYGFSALSGQGANQTIALIEAYGSPTIQSDLNAFCAAQGIPTTTVTIATPGGKPSTDSGWALETSLDVEWAHAIAPGAKLVVVEATSASLSSLLGAIDYAVKTLHANVVSMSWGAPEFSSESTYDSHFNKSGVTFVASSGDSGSGVQWPAVSQYVLGVGGTTLTYNPTTLTYSEAAWSGSGGGVSAYVTRPTYQNGFESLTKRGVPDVSYNADPSTGFPVYISNYGGSTGWVTVGGTSAGAPQWAALVAIANALRGSSLTGAELGIYATAVSSYSLTFTDILTGNNGAYSAVKGYDNVTGLGSPKANVLVNQLVTLPKGY